jgi:Zn-dependent peptidase ImmA (M78 family)
MHNPSTTIETRSVLAVLRSLVPQRPLSWEEANRIAELQANRLLRHFDITRGAVPSEIITELPRIRVEHEHDLPVSGSAHWNGHYWIITLCGDEHAYRQRYSLFHEFKHVVDHTTKHFLYQDRPGMSAEAQAERVADYFAACSLMSKRVVKRLWGEGHQSPTELSQRLRVSPAAVRYRLDQLGLTERRRCQPIHRTYYRQPVQGVAIA